MTTKTSLFNKGVYKSTVKRYLWGSILYFALLFMMTVLGFLLEKDMVKEYYSSYQNDSILLSVGYLLFPVMMTIIIPTITGLMIFRFVHSKKASVFTHSLPTNRIANYISSVCAGLTLMIAPIVVNTLLLMLVCVVAGGGLFTIADCVVWMFYNVFGIFIMFSGTCFVSFLTGNGLAMIVLNIIIYVLPPMMALCINRIAEIFIYGFPGDGQLATYLAEYSFPQKIISMVSASSYDVAEPTANIWVIIAMAVVMYVLATVFYVKRNMETVGDVAGFRYLNPVFKYLLTFVGAVLVFSALGNITEQNIIISSAIAMIVCSVIYFGIEMLLKKSTNVVSSIKGFAVIAVVCAVLMYIVAGTSFFGYETRIPDYDRISGVYVGEYREKGIIYVSDEDAINATLELHKEFLEKGSDYEWGNEINISYKLKNGSIVSRAYKVDYDEYEKIANRMSQIDSFKKITEPVFEAGVNYIRADIFNIDDPIEINSSEKVESLVKCLQKDIENLDYSSMNAFGWGFSVQVEYASVEGYGEDFFRYDVNSNFKETIKWIKENDYWDRVKINHRGPIIITKNDNYPYRDFLDMEVEIDFSDGIRVEEEDCEKLYEYIYTAEQSGIPSDEEYCIFAITNEEEGLCKLITVLSEKQVNEIVK